MPRRAPAGEAVFDSWELEVSTVSEDPGLQADVGEVLVHVTMRIVGVTYHADNAAGSNNVTKRTSLV